MQIFISFHPLLILEIEYGYYHETSRLINRVTNRRLGPFHINGKIIDVTFRLYLPPQLWIHPVFHSSLLKPYQDSTIPPRITPLPPPIELEDGPEYEVTTILDSKIVRNKLNYLVNWLGYSPNECTSEPIENVTNFRALLEDFHRQYLDKPGPSIQNNS